MKGRQNYIDVAKASGIIIMTMGHVSFGWEFNHWIAGFHRPLFFFISEYLFNEKEVDTYEYLKKKSRTLLLPYITFGIINYTIWIIVNHNIQDLEMISHLLFINTEGMGISGPLWFLTAMFIAYVILFFVNKYVITKKIKILVIVFLMCFGMLETYILSCKLPYVIGCWLVGSGFMYIGLMYKKYVDKHRIHRVIMHLVCFILASILIMLNGHVNMREGMYALIPVSVFNASVMSICILELSRSVCDKVNNNIEKKVIKCISAIGK